jgi:Leucine-rich repeat (LRR) protein
MVLKSLSCGSTQVSDLSPLQGMPMEWLSCYSTNVSSLSPLVGMPLKNLSCSNTPVSDLKPLTGMQLTNLTCPGTKVSDLTPLANVRTLSILDVRYNKVTPSAVAALQEALPNCKIDWDAATSSSPAGESAKPMTPEPAASGTK